MSCPDEGYKGKEGAGGKELHMTDCQHGLVRRDLLLGLPQTAAVAII